MIPRSSRRALLTETFVWAVVVGMVIAGVGSYIDIRDGVSGLLEDRWYFLRENLWWCPYYVAVIGIPLLIAVGLHGAAVRFVGRSIQHVAGAVGTAAGKAVSSQLSLPAFAGLYAAADGVASAFHTVIVNCVWSTLCGRGEWGATLAVSPVLFGMPLFCATVRRTFLTSLRRGSLSES